MARITIESAGGANKVRTFCSICCKEGDVSSEVRLDAPNVGKTFHSKHVCTLCASAITNVIAERKKKIEFKVEIEVS